MELEFILALILDAAAVWLLAALARKTLQKTLPVKILTLALGIVFIFFTSANCANGVHSPLIPSLIGLALSSAASCLALTDALEDRGNE